MGLEAMAIETAREARRSHGESAVIGAGAVQEQHRLAAYCVAAFRLTAIPSKLEPDRRPPIVGLRAEARVMGRKSSDPQTWTSPSPASKTHL